MFELIFILRNLINDQDSTIYTDDSLTQVICTSAFLVIAETPFISDYIVNLNTQEITPNPTYANADDIPFMTLISLKAAYMILNNEAKSYASQTGIKVIDGPSTVSIGNRYEASSKLAQQRKEEYDYLRNQIKLEYNGGNGLAVLTPTTVQTIMCNTWR